MSENCMFLIEKPIDDPGQPFLENGTRIAGCRRRERLNWAIAFSAEGGES